MEQGNDLSEMQSSDPSDKHNSDLTERKDTWWERNWWVVLLLLGCLLAGFVIGYGWGSSMLAADLAR